MTETATEPTETPTVAQAWSAVMGDVTHLGKDQRNASQGFNFRGIDDVMNLVGPVLRKHGVSILPYVRSREARDFTTKSGTVMHEVAVEVGYDIYGPAGDVISGSSFGESADSGDKATPKAMSVAFRTFLLQALCLPTDEPDPDQTITDRSTSGPDQAAAQKTADGLLVATDPEAVQRVKVWAQEKGLMDTQVNDADGNGLPLTRLFDRVLGGLGGDEAHAKAEEVLKDSLGAEKISETETKTEDPA